MAPGLLPPGHMLGHFALGVVVASSAVTCVVVVVLAGVVAAVVGTVVEIVVGSGDDSSASRVVCIMTGKGIIGCCGTGSSTESVN